MDAPGCGPLIPAAAGVFARTPRVLVACTGRRDIEESIAAVGGATARVVLTFRCALLGTLFCARTIWPVGARDEVTKTADDDDRLAADTPGREMGAR